MGLSWRVTGYRPPNEKWQKMKTIYDACIASDVRPPPQVEEFFAHEAPDDSGVTVQIMDYGTDTPAVKHVRGEYWEGLEVHLDNLPDGVNILRFTIS